MANGEEPRKDRGERETIYLTADEWELIDRERGEESRYLYLKRLVLDGLARQAEERARVLRNKVDQR